MGSKDYMVLMNKYVALQEEHSKLVGIYKNTRGSCDMLHEQYETLRKEYTKLKISHEEISESFDILKSKYHYTRKAIGEKSMEFINESSVIRNEVSPKKPTKVKFSPSAKKTSNHNVIGAKKK